MPRPDDPKEAEKWTDKYFSLYGPPKRVTNMQTRTVEGALYVVLHQQPGALVSDPMTVAIPAALFELLFAQWLNFKNGGFSSHVQAKVAPGPGVSS
jgi:hypothetical protein